MIGRLNLTSTSSLPETMRPKLPLAIRIAKATGVDVQVVEETLQSEPQPGHGDCWPWAGAVAKLTPVLKLAGKSQPVRRLLLEAVYGQPMHPRWLAKRICPNVFCVQPNHSQLIRTAWPDCPRLPRRGGGTEDDPPAAALQLEGLSLDDMIDMILSLDDGRELSAEELASRFDEPVTLTRTALEEIRAQGL